MALHSPPRSGRRTTPLSRAISSMSLRGRGRSRALDCEERLRTLSRSRLPKETVHRLSLFDRSVPSTSSGPWYGRTLRRLRGGCFGASGGGVGGLRWTVKSNKEMIKELCSWTATSLSYASIARPG